MLRDKFAVRALTESELKETPDEAKRISKAKSLTTQLLQDVQDAPYSVAASALVNAIVYLIWRSDLDNGVEGEVLGASISGMAAHFSKDNGILFVREEHHGSCNSQPRELQLCPTRKEQRSSPRAQQPTTLTRIAPY